MLVLGASPNEQASFSGPRSSVTCAARASVLVRWPVTAMIGTASVAERRQQPNDFLRLAALREDQHQVGSMDSSQVAVDGFAGVQKWLRVPVEASVAAIFWPINPALPMPVTITLPGH